MARQLRIIDIQRVGGRVAVIFSDKLCVSFTDRTHAQAVVADYQERAGREILAAIAIANAVQDDSLRDRDVSLDLSTALKIETRV